MERAANSIVALVLPMGAITNAIQQEHAVRVSSGPHLARVAVNLASVQQALSENRVGPAEFAALAKAFDRSGSALTTLATLTREGKTLVSDTPPCGW